MSTAAAIPGPLGRFIGGACALMANAGAGAAAGVLAQGGSPEAAAGILAAFSAFAGVTSMATGTRANETEDKLDEILLRLRKLMHEHRTLHEVFGHGDPALAAERLRGEPELLAFLKEEAEAREAESDQFRMGLSVLIDEAIEQGQFREDAIAALAGLDAKMDAVLDGQQRAEAKVDELAQYLIVQNQQLHAENRGLAVKNESLRNQVRAALQRVANAETAAGRDPLKRLEELRQGDAHDLLAFLDEQIDKDELDLIEKHRERAAVAYTVGEIDKAEASLRKILALEPDDVDAVNRTGHIFALRGELAKAEEAYRRVLELAGHQRDAQAAAYGNLGSVLRSLGKLEQAEIAYLKGIVIEKELGREDALSGHLGNLAVVVEERGDLERAEQLQRKALTMARRTGIPLLIGNHAGNLGLLLRRKGQSHQAAELVRESLRIAVDLKQPEGIANAHSALGLILVDLRRDDDARWEHMQALRFDEKLGRKEGIATHNANLGSIAKRQGHAAEARRLWLLARDLYAQMGATPMAERAQGWLDGLPPG